MQARSPGGRAQGYECSHSSPFTNSTEFTDFTLIALVGTNLMQLVDKADFRTRVQFHPARRGVTRLAHPF